MWLWRSDSDDRYDQPGDDYVEALSTLSPTAADALQLEEQDERAPCDWNASFRDACVSLQTLTLTPHQVLEYLERTHHENKSSPCLELPKEVAVTLWNSTDVVPRIVKRYAQQQQQQHEIANKKSSGLLTTIGSQLWHRIVRTQVVEDVDVWNETSDDHAAERNLGWDQKAVNIDLAVECWNELVDHAAGRAFFRNGDTHFSFMGWIRTLPEPGLLSKLSDEQINLLLNALLDMKHAKVVDDILVFGVSSEMNLDVRIALLRLDLAIQQTEAALERWTSQRDAAVTRAVQCKRQNRMGTAMDELKRKALYESHLERTHNTLLNLEQTRHAVESSQSQAHLVRLLDETAALWRATRQEGVTAEEIDNLALDLAEEVVLLDNVNSKLFQFSKSETDVDELLAELDHLTLADDTQTNNDKELLHIGGDVSIASLPFVEKKKVVLSESSVMKDNEERDQRRRHEASSSLLLGGVDKAQCVGLS